jgi:2-polyprenyl-6-hydroxyphenyl methylase/3-demethylubiquinone-9 3-methyltransferase
MNGAYAPGVRKYNDKTYAETFAMTIKQSTIDSEEIAKFSALSKHWWDAEGALKTLHHINPTRFEFIKKYLNVHDKKILDVGCGGGILSETLAREGAQVTGIDAEQDAILIAQNHAVQENLQIEYICTPIETMEEAFFDAIVCMEMLEHVADPALVINHCARLLKHEGYLFLSTINRTLAAYGAAVIAAEYILQLLPKQTHDFTKFIKPGELDSMARDAGFELIGLEGMSYNPFSGVASLQKSVSVNYVMAFVKTG